ncbi:hypothetical protein Bbelb_347770 [Branchiostoma belcheri]|nr:hypothetical protein Bbelb_347770 [Branchiostoma belcheri]
MDRKLRHVLIFLLIILKEPDMTEAGCYCRPSWCNCRKEDLTSIPQNLPTSISSIMLTRNRIKTVNKSELLRYKKLSKLHLDYNQITTIPSGTLAYLPQLQYLSFYNNQITNIHPGAFTNLPKLQELLLECNQITTIPPGTFVNMLQLQRLWLRNNQITAISSGAFSNLPKLEKMPLSRNQIATIPSGAIANLPKLQELYMTHNQVKYIPSGTFANLTQLQVLFLLRNQITTISFGTFVNLPKLQKLSLNHNQITTIESGAFANLTQLQTLALDQNQITTIPSGTFANLPKLQRLGLSYNQITTINSGAFENLPLLNGLGLRNNKMTAIPLSVFCFLPSTIKIELGRNPWQCDCKMAPFKLIHEFKNQIICAQPAKLQGQKLAHVDPKELICKEPTISPLTVHSSSAAVSTSSVGNTESNTSPSVFKATAGSTANPAEKTSKSGATLTSPVAITSEMPESAPSSPQLTTSKRIADIHLISYNSHYHWYFKFNAAPMSDHVGKTRATLTSPLAITSEKPEFAPNFPLLVPIGSSCGSVASTILIGTFLVVIWYKKRIRHPPLRLNPNVVGGNTNTSASLMASGDNHQYEEIDKPRVKTGQGQSQANTASNTNTIVTVLASGHDQTGQGQSQTVTESLDVRNLSYCTGQTASQQNSVYKVVTQSQTITNTIATVMASGDVQTGQGQYQAITESLDARNLSYGTGPTASQLNSVYKTATVMTSGQDQTVRGQSQAITESNTSTTATEMTSDHYYQYEDIENNLLKTGQGQSQIH